jgi:hypothetical protein
MGWARANMMYDTMSSPPRPGSLLEILFVMVQMRRDVVRLMETRAVVQALRDNSDEGEATQSAFDDYRYAVMPYLVGEKKAEERRIMEIMSREFTAGPMSVKSVQHGPAVKSRLQRVIRSIKELPQPKIGWRR